MLLLYADRLLPMDDGGLVRPRDYIGQAVAYLGGGPWCDGPPPFGRTMKIFYRRLYIKRCVFCHFPAKIAKFNDIWWSFAFPNLRKMGDFAVSTEHSEAKSVSDPHYRLALRALAMPPLCQILNTPLRPRPMSLWSGALLDKHNHLQGTAKK